MGERPRCGQLSTVGFPGPPILGVGPPSGQISTSTPGPNTSFLHSVGCSVRMALQHHLPVAELLAQWEASAWGHMTAPRVRDPPPHPPVSAPRTRPSTPPVWSLPGLCVTASSSRGQVSGALLHQLCPSLTWLLAPLGVWHTAPRGDLLSWTETGSQVPPSCWRPLAMSTQALRYLSCPLSRPPFAAGSCWVPPRAVGLPAL